MCNIKAVFWVVVTCFVCGAQSVNIQGVVKDTAGTAIAGVVVKLEKAGYPVTTDAEGKFTISDMTSSGPGQNIHLQQQSLSAMISNGIFSVTVAERSPVEISTYNLSGKEIAVTRRTLDAGTHAIGPVQTGAGLYIYKVKSGNNELVMKSHTMGRVFANAQKSMVSDGSLAKATASFKDVIAASKSGYLDYQMPITSATASNVEIRMLFSAGTVKDYDGNEYQTVKLGNQVWTAEHFRCTKLNDGSAITLANSTGEWANRTTPAYCFFNGTSNADTIKKFGALYNFHVINTKKIAPAGWHVPSESEWMALQNWLIANGYNYDGTKSGNKIGKSMASRTDWASSSVTGAIGNDLTKNNKSGFNAQSNGFRGPGGDFGNKGNRCIMHCTAIKQDQWGSFGYFGDLNNTSAEFRYSDDWMSMGFSLRLIKD